MTHAIRPKTKISLFLLLFVLCFASFGADIAIFGDTQTNDKVHRQVVAAIVAHKPEIAFHTGDLTSYGLAQSEFDNFFAIEKPITDICTLYPAKGNHERSRELFLANFPILQGRTYYTVEHDSLLFIILDSTLGLKLSSEQHTWLQQTLSADSLQAKIILQHYPVFSSAYHGTDADVSLFLPAMLKDYKVLLVSSGHDHNYERLEYGGITYLVAGGAGGRLRKDYAKHPYSKIFANTHNYLILDRQGNTLTVTAYDLEGQILDSFSLILP